MDNWFFSSLQYYSLINFLYSNNLFFFSLLRALNIIDIRQICQGDWRPFGDRNIDESLAVTRIFG